MFYRIFVPLVLCLLLLGAPRSTHGYFQMNVQENMTPKEQEQHHLRQLKMAKRIGRRFYSTDKKRPVVLVPGIGGTILDAKLHDKPKETHLFCQTNSPTYRLWLAVNQLLPGIIDCFIDNVQLDFEGQDFKKKFGVNITPVRTLDGIAYLDPANGVTKAESSYFAHLITGLEAAGWSAGSNLRGFGFDWRQAKQNVEWGLLREMIESLAEQHGGPAIVITHSMGGPYFRYFLSTMSNAWKQQNVHLWICVAAPLTGAPLSVKAQISGYNFGVPLIKDSEGVKLARLMPASFGLMPTGNSWGTIVSSAEGVFKTSEQDYLGLLKAANVTDGAAKLGVTWSRSQLSANVEPGVKVACAAGIKVDTELSYVYNDLWSGGDPKKIVKGSGDGTVPVSSASVCSNWNDTMSYTEFPGAEHVGMLRTPAFLTYTLQTISNAD